jgi:hypothetical protein
MHAPFQGDPGKTIKPVTWKEASTASPKRKQGSDVVAGVLLCAAAPLELLYATSRGRENIAPCRHIFIDLVSAGNKTRDSKQQLHFRQCQI